MASTFFTRLFNPILRSSRSISSSVLRPCPCLPRTLQPTARRFAHSIPKPRSPAPSATASSSSSSETKSRKLLEPHYELTFTCVPCGDRSTHIISKQGYHKGSVLITCPSCRNRHVISDHLNIFGNRKITVEDLMREKGQLVKRGTLGEDGDVEFWEDGTMTERRGGSPSGSSSSTEVKNELDTLSEEESATRSREAKDPSSQSAEPINKTPTQFSGTRPSLDSTQSTHHVPSTRRQYSSIKNYSLDWYDSRLGPFGYSSRLPTRPSGPPKRPDAVVKDFDLEDSLRRRHRIPKEEMIEQKKKQVAD
ncbi:DNL zinc finger-domain-containing protein [Hypoxylon cercidicola]|nr:DNL zinc finger-domain-containing protein [Hypoxylon cercidicola]